MKNRRRRSRRLLPTFPPVAQIHRDWQLLPRSLKCQRWEVTLSEVTAGQLEGESRAASHLGLLLLPHRRRRGWHSAEFPRICGEFQTSVFIFSKAVACRDTFIWNRRATISCAPTRRRLTASYAEHPVYIYRKLQKTSNKRSNSRRQMPRQQQPFTQHTDAAWRQPEDAAAAQLHVCLWIRS